LSAFRRIAINKAGLTSPARLRKEDRRSVVEEKAKGCGDEVAMFVMSAAPALANLASPPGERSGEGRAWVDETTNTAGDTETRIFDMRFFNARDVNIALWDVKVEYYREGSRIGTIVPRPGPTPQPIPVPPQEVEPIDLESRKSVFVSLELVAEGE
jgi:hypothetical protein